MPNTFEVQKGLKGYALINKEQKMIIDWFNFNDEELANGICDNLNNYKEGSF